MTDERRMGSQAPEENAQLVDPKQADLADQHRLADESLPGVTRDYDVSLTSGSDPDRAEEETLRRLRDGEKTDS